MEPLESLLERIAAGTPTPGGGAVSAICGAMSTALSRMVANLAAGKQGYEAAQAELAAIEARGKALQQRFLELAKEDEKAYDAVVAAMRLPKANDVERATRKDAMQAAYKRATEVPMEIIRASLDALEIARLAAERGSRSAITDVGVGTLLAQAAMRGGALNVRINLAAIADAAWRAAVDEELEKILANGATLAHAVDDLVNERL
ncbi:MAG TPA: cyclodeaminase/cyclohydrolase family protein [Thermoplasmata archaeon]|nr:cyclodeaminase/cyclohydrolase family protein [Thermoplasmata archaeon]